MGGEEVVFAEPEEDVGLSDAAVADDEDFGEVVVTALSLHFDLIISNKT